MTLSCVSAFCPGHISGYFRPILMPDSSASGSVGGGIVINEGVRVTVRPSQESSIRIMHAIGDAEPVCISTESHILSLLLTMLDVSADIETSSFLPLSSGYGLSAAALLASTYALNRLFSLGLSDQECALYAHIIEVQEQTGLGDVSACQGGGWVTRSGPGIYANIKRHYCDTPIYAVTLGPLHTRSIISSKEFIDNIIRAFPDGEPETLEELMSFSRRFAEASDLISTDIRKVLTACDTNNVQASMTMLGNGVFARGDQAKEILMRFENPFLLQIAENGPKITGEI
ncbi:MAG TPA: GHMP kinase [Methanospirillum sp.]|nr:GHMP kinase [Methanospirillum sp.]